MKVFLISYDKFEHIPVGAVILDANILMPKAEFDTHLADGCAVTLLAVLIRLRAIASTTFEHVWFWDCDTHVLVDLRYIGVQPVAFNHVIASMDMSPSSPGTSTEEFELMCARDFAKTPRDKAISSSPFKSIGVQPGRYVGGHIY